MGEVSPPCRALRPRCPHQLLHHLQPALLETVERGLTSTDAGASSLPLAPT
jgi:hypothetical protein